MKKVKITSMKCANYNITLIFLLMKDVDFNLFAYFYLLLHCLISSIEAVVVILVYIACFITLPQPESKKWLCVILPWATKIENLGFDRELRWVKRFRL